MRHDQMQHLSLRRWLEHSELLDKNTNNCVCCIPIVLESYEIYPAIATKDIKKSEKDAN